MQTIFFLAVFQFPDIFKGVIQNHGDLEEE